MELRLLIVLFRRWIWLLLMGAIIGGATGYFYSVSQPPVYRSSTKVMVMQPRESLTSDLTALTDAELAETFRNLLVVRPVLDATSEQVGGPPVQAGQISSKLIEGTQLLQVTVQDRVPERAAVIANTLVEALIEQNESMQSDRFRASEESLQAQIAQVEAQMAELRAEEGQRTELSEEEVAAQQKSLEDQILQLNAQIDQVEEDITALSTSITSPTLMPVQNKLLNERNAELTLLELRLQAANSRYEELLAEGASESVLRIQSNRVLEIVEQISSLEETIAALTVIEETPEQAEQRQALLREKQAELSLLNLNLDLASQSYQRLTYPESVTGNQDSQGGANMALYQQIYSSLLSNYEAVRLARTQGTPNVVQVELATPGAPVRPNEISNALLGAAIGLIVTGSIAFIVEYLDDTLKTPEDIDRVLNLPVVGFVSDAEELSVNLESNDGQIGPYVSNYPRAPLGEAFRTLRTNLEFANVDDSLKTILVTSAGPGEGKTTIAANLAATFSQQQKRVVLLDCDLRKPKLHKIFDIANDIGMSDVFIGRAELQEATYLFGSNLAVVTSGRLPSNPAELLGSDSMTQFLDSVVEISDVVVIDSPPSIVTDAAILSTKVDGVVLVVNPGRTHADDARAQLEQMRRAGARVVGVVLNRIPRKRGGYYGRYGYQYHYYQYGYGHYYGEDQLSANGQQKKPRKRRFGRLFRPKKEEAVLQRKIANPSAEGNVK